MRMLTALSPNYFIDWLIKRLGVFLCRGTVFLCFIGFNITYLKQNRPKRILLPLVELQGFGFNAMTRALFVTRKGSLQKSDTAR